MKMEPIVSSETSTIRTQTPGNYPKRKKLHLEHGESLKTSHFKLQNKILFFRVGIGFVKKEVHISDTVNFKIHKMVI